MNNNLYNADELFLADVPAIEEKIGYSFHDPSLLMQAFTRTSFCNEHNLVGVEPYQSNEVLEFFGDSLLSGAVITFLIRDFSVRYRHGIRTKYGEGTFSNIKSRLSDKKNLSLSMRELGLQQYLRLGEGDRKLGIANEPSVMEDLFESIVGAVYIDSGLQMPAVLSVVNRMLDMKSYLSVSDVPPTQSPKNTLQEFCAARPGMPLPNYEVVEEAGPDHMKSYHVVCRIGGLKADAWGKNKKAAETEAADLMLALLMQMLEVGSFARTFATPAAEPFVNWVGKLGEYASRHYPNRLPLYKDHGNTASDATGVPCFSFTCRFCGMLSTGTASNKKSAKQEAAKAMMQLVRQNASMSPED